MKRRFPFALSAILLACAGWTPTATAATEAQKLAAILAGDNHLDSIQGSNGAWRSTDAYTGAAVFALLTHQNKWTLAATGNGGAVTAYPNLTVAKYTADVNSGINYLLNNVSVATVSVNSNTGANICPGGSGTCQAVYWSGCGDATYCTGLVTPAIDTYALSSLAGGATSTINASGACSATGGQGGAALSCSASPVNGMTWVQIAQGITNAFAAAQSGATAFGGVGGWRYAIPSDNESDMSTTQWGAISSGYDENVGAVTPAVVKSNLRTYLTYQISGTTNPDIGVATYLGPLAPTDLGAQGPTASENGGWLTSNAWTGGVPAGKRIGLAKHQLESGAKRHLVGKFRNSLRHVGRIQGSRVDHRPGR